MTAALALAEQRPQTAPAGTEGRAWSLERLIAAVWDGLASRRAVACPVCGGHLEPRYEAGARPIAGRCTDCGSTLS